MVRKKESAPRLREKYYKEIVPVLMKDLGYSNVMQIPRVEKVVISIGLGEAIQNAKAIESASIDLTTIAGQHPIVTRAKKSIATYKLREGMPIGIMVTLRGRRMYEFLDRLINVVLPRIRDFRGVPRNSFDGQGNYNLGLKDQLVFPEINYDKIDKARGLGICIVNTASSDEEGRRLLELMGMPFMKG